MTVKYVLNVHRDLRLINYSPRLKVMLNLREAIVDNKLKHSSLSAAVKAAKVISKSPIVTYIELTRVEESKPLIFRNGEEHTC